MRLGVEAVAFGLVVQAFHRCAGALERRFHALGMLDRRTLVFATGGEEHRHLDPFGQVHRRHRAQLGRITQPFAQVGHA